MPSTTIRDPLPVYWTEWHRLWSKNCAHLGVSLSQAHVNKQNRRCPV
jgi:hypothetical protein